MRSQLRSFFHCVSVASAVTVEYEVDSAAYDAEDTDVTAVDFDIGVSR